MRLRDIPARLRAAYSAARLRNPFVYEACGSARIREPDIPVPAVECYGQLGEDLIVAALLSARSERDGTALADTQYVEIGGNHPFATSGTFLLSRLFGMTGTIVEANPALLDDLRRGRPNDDIVHAAIFDQNVDTVELSVSPLSEISSIDGQFAKQWSGGGVGESALIKVPAMRVDRLLKEHAAKPVSFLSIDIEGLDLRVLKDLDLVSCRPWFIQAEPSELIYPGTTSAMISVMRANSYTLVARTKWNLIFEESATKNQTASRAEPIP